ncbi:unnamed protein product [Cunninghamella blakesleeana]
MTSGYSPSFSSPNAPPLASTPSPILTSPIHSVPTSLPIVSSPEGVAPPPLPSKPTAYNSNGHYTPNINNNGNASSSSSNNNPPNFPPPSYVANQPPLPPRERTISQISQYMPSPMIINNNPSQHNQHPSSYHSSLNVDMTPAIGHQFLNYQNYYPGTPLTQSQDLYPPPNPSSTPANNHHHHHIPAPSAPTPQMNPNMYPPPSSTPISHSNISSSNSSSNVYPPTNNYMERPPLQPHTNSSVSSGSFNNINNNSQRRDPAMLIIPPKKEKQSSPPQNHVYPSHIPPTSNTPNPAFSMPILNIDKNNNSNNNNNNNNNNNKKNEHSNNPYKNSNIIDHNQNQNINHNQFQYNDQSNHQRTQSEQFFQNQQQSFNNLHHHRNNMNTTPNPSSNLNNHRMSTSIIDPTTSFQGTATHVSPKMMHNIPSKPSPPKSSSAVSGTVTHISPKISSSLPPPQMNHSSSSSSLISNMNHITPKMTPSISNHSTNTMKPDTRWENDNHRGYNNNNSNTNISTNDLINDNDENDSLVFERNDGRMMASSLIGQQNNYKNNNSNEKHIINDHQQKDKKETVVNEEEFDSDNYQSDDDGDDQHDDQAIDPFDINISNDTVMIHQNNSPTMHHQLSRKNTKISIHHNEEDEEDEEDENHHSTMATNDPFADTFAVGNRMNNNQKADKISCETTNTNIDHGRSKSLGNIESKSFQMNQSASTIAMVHDPLVMRAMANANATPTPSFKNNDISGSSSSSRPTRPQSTLPWNHTNSPHTSSSVTIGNRPYPSSTPTPSMMGSSIPRPASVYQHPLYQSDTNNQNDNDDNDSELHTLDSNEIHYVAPTNVVRAGAPPNLDSMISQVTSEVPSNEFGYYHYDITKPGGEKEEISEEDIEEAIDKALPKLPKTNPDHRHITVPSVIEDQRVWIIHPTDTGKQLASRIQIVATYKTRKITKITTDSGREVPLDDTPVFTDWADVISMKDGTPWKVEWTLVDHSLWEGPKEFLRYLKASLRS